MTTQTPDLETLTRRLNRLEQQNRWLRRAGLLALAAVGTVLLMAQAPINRTIEAERFVLRASRGAARADLSIQGPGPSLTFFE